MNLVLAWMLTIAQAAEQSPTAKPQLPGTFQVKVTKGDLSLEANEAPFAKVLEEIGKQAGIAVDSNIGPEEKITIQFNDVPIEEALKRLSKKVTIVYVQDPKQKKTRITRVVVLSEKKGGSTQFEKGRSQQESATEKKAAVQAEPFKFGFDPAKSMVKEKRQ